MNALPDADDPSPLPPLLDALLESSEDSLPPKDGILALAEAMRADEALAARAIAEYRVEIDAGDDAEGTFGVWLAFALALSGREDAGEALLEAVRRDPAEADPLPPGLNLALKGALVARGEWTLRRLASFFPLDVEGLKNQVLACDLLHLARAAVFIEDETLLRCIADEAARLLPVPGLPDYLVLETCTALAAADPARALELVPPCLPRCMQREWMEKVLREIEKKGSAERLLASPWEWNAKNAAEEFLVALETASGDEEEAGEREGESDLREELEAAKPLIEAFLCSERRRGIPGDDEEIADALDSLLFHFLSHHAPGLRSARAEDIAEFMTETLPREVASKREAFERFGVLLPAFLFHLADQGVFPFALACAEEAERRAGEMVRNAEDPAKWGEDKGRVMDMLRAGVDLADGRAVGRWIRDHGGDGDAWEDDLGPRVPPTVREERSAEPDPYDPCPCGSGEKYKFCCKKKKRG
jgi:hypothetical protein